MLEIPETTAISEQVASFLSGRTIVTEAHLGGEEGRGVSDVSRGGTYP